MTRDERSISRRRFALKAASLLTAGVVAEACHRKGGGQPPRDARLRARPLATVTSRKPGTLALGLGGERDGVLQLPDTGNDPVPLFVLLHGAGGDGEGFLDHLLPMARAQRVALLAPDSRGATWDAVLPEYRSIIDVLTSSPAVTGFGPDVAFLDRALEQVFQAVSVDPARIVIGGFSDGATYALSLGLINGDLFRRIVAFSPGFIADAPPRDRPSVFVSHGRADRILPIDRSSRRIVPALRGRGYDVTYREFDGGHGIPDAIAREAIAWAARPLRPDA